MILNAKQKALYYSLDKELGIKKLKVWEIDQKYDTKNLESWMGKHAIYRQIADEEGYHFKLHRIASKPYIIYYQWNIELLNASLLWIVGPRKVSNYAKSVMKDAFADLKKYAVVTISGGAPGVDTICHELSLENNIPTIMVLGAGLWYYLQHQQRHLIKKIVDAWWLIISEFKLKQEPTNYTFPQRNRIVAWLSDAVFVPAAGKKSWSLITVDFALKTHTSVYSVPASIYDETSAGSNVYIAEWKIKAVTNFDHLFSHHFDIKDTQEQQKSLIIDLSNQQQRIVDYMSKHWTQVLEKIASWLQIPLHDVLAEITLLEMQGVVYETKPGMRTVK